MSNESISAGKGRSRYETMGPSWSERSHAGELGAVLDPSGSKKKNLFLHSLNLFAANVALSRSPKKSVLLDFGCGTGRFVRFFGGKGYSVIGTEITLGMLTAARQFGLPKRSVLMLNDGVSIPVRDHSVDIVWVCGVLKYSLFDHPYQVFELQEDPTYPQIAREMFRILKPGGNVVNLEMYINNVRPEVFTRDFEEAGFLTKEVRIVQRYGRLERLYQSLRLPLAFVAAAGKLCAAYRYWFDDPRRSASGLCDYLFVWHKPKQ